jgi:hypothetical protein
MTRAEWRSAHRNARLGRRHASATWPEHEWSSAALGHHHGIRHPAAWALTLAALIAATVAVWRIAPGERQDQALAVSVPAASTPAAAEGAY